MMIVGLNILGVVGRGGFVKMGEMTARPVRQNAEAGKTCNFQHSRCQAVLRTGNQQPRNPPTPPHPPLFSFIIYLFRTDILNNKLQAGNVLIMGVTSAHSY